MGAGSPAHDIRNGRGVNAPRSAPRFPETVSEPHDLPHSGPQGSNGTQRRKRSGRTRGDARGRGQKALKCLPGRDNRGDRRDTCGKRAVVTSIQARKPKRRAEMLCHVGEAMTRRNQGFFRMWE